MLCQRATQMLVANEDVGRVYNVDEEFPLHVHRIFVWNLSFLCV